MKAKHVSKWTHNKFIVINCGKLLWKTGPSSVQMNSTSIQFNINANVTVHTRAPLSMAWSDFKDVEGKSSYLAICQLLVLQHVHKEKQNSCSCFFLLWWTLSLAVVSLGDLHCFDFWVTCRFIEIRHLTFNLLQVHELPFLSVRVI